MERGLALRPPREVPTLRWEGVTLDNWYATPRCIGALRLREVVVRLNTFTRMTPARGLVFTLRKGRSRALASSFKTTTSGHAALTRSKNGLTVSVSAVPIVSSKIIPSPILRMAASLSLAHQAVSSITTRLWFKMCVLSSDRKAYVTDMSFFPRRRALVVSTWSTMSHGVSAIYS